MCNKIKLRRITHRIKNIILAWAPKHIIDETSVGLIRDLLNQSLSLLETHKYISYGIDKQSYNAICKNMKHIIDYHHVQPDAFIFMGMVKNIYKIIRGVASNFPELRGINLESLSHEQFLTKCNERLPNSVEDAPYKKFRQKEESSEYIPEQPKAGNAEITDIFNLPNPSGSIPSFKTKVIFPSESTLDVRDPIKCSLCFEQMHARSTVCPYCGLLYIDKLVEDSEVAHKRKLAVHRKSLLGKIEEIGLAALVINASDYNLEKEALNEYFIPLINKKNLLIDKIIEINYSIKRGSLITFYKKAGDSRTNFTVKINLPQEMELFYIGVKMNEKLKLDVFCRGNLYEKWGHPILEDVRLGDSIV